MSGDWLRMSAADLGRGIAAGNIDPLDLTDAFLAAIDAHPLAPRIYALTTPDRARSEAQAASARAKAGRRVGPLDGVPISWKDLYDTAGTLTEAGTALLKGRVPDRDARVLRNATSAGLVCLGKTHMTELAFSALGLNPITQSPPCVNYPDAVAGGSSSGAATSVAYGLAAAGIGSDTGGSVRVPAVWNDLVGLKTTPEALSLEGVVPLCAKFDTVGPLTRNVEDAALLWTALGGGRPVDLGGASLSGRRFLVLETTAMDDMRDPPGTAFEGAVRAMEAGGATIVRGGVPSVAKAFNLAGLLYAPAAYGRWKDEIEANPDKMFAPVLERFRAGAQISAPDYSRAWEDLLEYRDEYRAATAEYDGVLVATSPILPPNMDRLLSDQGYFAAENLLALRNTRIGNLMGLAVITLPTGVPSCGISIMGAPGSEARLLRLGTATEAAIG